MWPAATSSCSGRIARPAHSHPAANALSTRWSQASVGRRHNLGTRNLDRSLSSGFWEQPRHGPAPGFPAPSECSFPAATATPLLRLRSPAESWGLESAGVLRFCANDLGLRGRNERPILSLKCHFSPRPGTMGVLASGQNALKYIDLTVLYRTVSWSSDWVGRGTGSESLVPSDPDHPFRCEKIGLSRGYRCRPKVHLGPCSRSNSSGCQLSQQALG